MRVSVAQSRPSLRQVLIAFKRQANAVVQTYPDLASQTFFKPSKVLHLRLRPIGYTNHVPCINGLPFLHSDEQCMATKLLVAQRHKFNEHSTKAHADGTFVLKAQRISYRGAIPDAWFTPRCSSTQLFPRIAQEQCEQKLYEAPVVEIQMTSSSFAPRVVFPATAVMSKSFVRANGLRCYVAPASVLGLQRSGSADVRGPGIPVIFTRRLVMLLEQTRGVANLLFSPRLAMGVLLTGLSPCSILPVVALMSPVS